MLKLDSYIREVTYLADGTLFIMILYTEFSVFMDFFKSQ